MEPPLVCQRLQQLSRMEHYEQINEQIFTKRARTSRMYGFRWRGGNAKAAGPLPGSRYAISMRGGNRVDFVKEGELTKHSPFRSFNTSSEITRLVEPLLRSSAQN